MAHWGMRLLYAPFVAVIMTMKGNTWPMILVGNMLSLTKITAFFLITALLPIQNALAKPLESMTEREILACGIGEASNQGVKGMQAVFEVLRRRGDSKGFYGCDSGLIDKEPAWVLKQAQEAWIASADSNITKDATHFEAVKAFGTPYWAKNMKKTAVIGDHSFYRP